MKALDELRQHGGAFPGGLYNVLVEMDQRISVLEAHGPMLADLAPEYQQELARRAEREANANPVPEPEQPEPPAAPGPVAVPEPAQPEVPAVQSLEPQQEPNEGAQGVQS